MYMYPFMTTARPMIPFSVNYTDGPIELIEYRRRRRLCFAFATADGESRRGTRTPIDLAARASPKSGHKPQRHN